MDITSLRKAIKEDNFEWRKHTLIRLAERNIFQESVLRVILEGEIIEEYPLDKPFSSCLIFGMLKEGALHVVVSFDEEYQKAYIITAYQPSLEKFESNFKTRRL